MGILKGMITCISSLIIMAFNLGLGSIINVKFLFLGTFENKKVNQIEFFSHYHPNKFVIYL